MINSIDGYLDSLKVALKGCDNATIQDALSDAEEHLRTAIDKGLEESDKVVEADILLNVIDKYGSPDEIANAYRDIEDRIRPAFARTQVSSNIYFFEIFRYFFRYESLGFLNLHVVCTGDRYNLFHLGCYRYINWILDDYSNYRNTYHNYIFVFSERYFFY